MACYAAQYLWPHTFNCIEPHGFIINKTIYLITTSALSTHIPHAPGTKVFQCDISADMFDWLSSQLYSNLGSAITNELIYTSSVGCLQSVLCGLAH